MKIHIPWVRLILLCLGIIISACNSPNREISITPTAINTSLEKETQTPEKQPSRTEEKTTISTITILSTVIPIHEITNELVLTIEKGLGNFSVAPDGSIWVHVSIEAGADELWQFDKGKLMNKIALFSPGKLDGIEDFEVTDRGIWILDLANWRPTEVRKVVNLGLDGTILSSYAIPKKLFIGPDEEYIGSGVDHIIVEEGENILLEGATGLYRFFNSEGKVDPIRLEGFLNEGKEYKIINPGGNSIPCVIQVGDQNIKVDYNKYSWCQKIIGFGMDGSFFVRLGNLTDQVITILHFTKEGKLFETAEIPYGDVLSFPPAFAPDYKIGLNGDVYISIYNENQGSWQIYRLLFSPYISQ